MPKVYLTDSQKDHDRLVENLTLIQKCKQKNNTQMGQILGISSSAYSARKRKPENLTYSEIKKLCTYAKIEISSFMTERLKLV